jgi:glycopeptide antibiotics resistance protein
MDSIRYNLIPFKTIANYMLQRGSIGFDVFIYNLAGNVVAFMPLGFLLPLAFRDFRARKTYFVSFVLIIFAEVSQLVSRRGVFDVDDLLLNMLGSIIGYGIYKLLFTLLNDRR